jgi:taurine dioxygenase
VKTPLAGLRAIHSAAPAYGPSGLFARDDDSRSMDIVISKEAEATESHPIVRTHPHSGRRSLFVNHVYTVAVEGMHRFESRSLLRELFDHMVTDEFTYRHKWRPDMLVLWDNRCVLHYAEGGYEGHRRVMHRTVVAGERPQH